MIEKSNFEQMKSRESQVGGIVADRFLVNGLIRAGRMAFCLVKPDGIFPR